MKEKYYIYNIPDRRSSHKGVEYQGDGDGFEFQLRGEADAPPETASAGS